jgi:hypothetical protein
MESFAGVHVATMYFGNANPKGSDEAYKALIRKLILAELLVFADTKASKKLVKAAFPSVDELYHHGQIAASQQAGSKYLHVWYRKL